MPTNTILRLHSVDIVAERYRRPRRFHYWVHATWRFLRRLWFRVRWLPWTVRWMTESLDGTGYRAYKGRYSDGGTLVKHGRATEYYSDGRLEATIDYVDDREHGVEVTYHRNGLRSSEGGWRCGKKHGTWLEWEEHGELVGRDVYVDGKRVSHWKLPGYLPAEAYRTGDIDEAA